MSYYLYDANGYLADGPSIGGMAKFREWSTGAVREFAEAGVCEDLEALVAELEVSYASDPTIDSTRRSLLDAARQADTLLIVSDGVEP